MAPSTTSKLFLNTLRDGDSTTSMGSCMGTVESRPETLIDPLGKDQVSLGSTGEGNSAV